MSWVFHDRRRILEDRLHQHVDQSRLNSVTADIGDKNPSLAVLSDEVQIVATNGLAWSVEAIDLQTTNLGKTIREQTLLHTCRHFELILQLGLAFSQLAVFHDQAIQRSNLFYQLLAQALFPQGIS